MAINTAVEPLTFTMTQNTWTKALEGTQRDSIYLENENAVTDARYQFPIGGNPFAYDFITNTDIAITPILTAPNTWASAERGSIMVKFKADAHAGIRYLVSFGDTNADTHLSLWIDESEKVAASCELAGVEQWTFTSDNAISVGVWYDVKLRMKESINSPYSPNPILFLNGDPMNLTYTTSTDKTAWMSVLPLVDNGFIGTASFNSAGKAGYFEGEIDSVKIIEHADPNADTGGNSQIAHYKLDEGTSTTAGDSFSHGDDGTITAGAGGWVARTDGTLIAKETLRFLSKSDGDGYIENPLWVFSTAASHDIEITESITRKIKG